MVAEKATAIRNMYGFHVRPGTRFMTTARNFRSRIRVFAADGREADGRSVVELMALGVLKGETIRIVAEGEDEAEALAALVALVESGFDGID